MIGDTNIIIREFLAGQAAIPGNALAIVNKKIYCPRLPEKAILPALAFFTRGGTSTPYIPDIPEPSVQFDCWGTSPQQAREVYRALYSVLQGIQNVKVTIPTVPPVDYYIKSAIEEVQGQDIQPVDPQGYHRVITFFRVMLEV